jgi:hypothetical protein
MPVANVPANLLFKSTTVEVAHADRRPTQLSHQACNVPMRGGLTLALRHFQDIHQSLSADALKAIEPCRPTHTFQAQAPRVYVLCGFEFGGGSFHSL